jgi:hypothetical protein
MTLTILKNPIERLSDNLIIPSDSAELVAGRRGRRKLVI